MIDPKDPVLQEIADSLKKLCDGGKTESAALFLTAHNPTSNETQVIRIEFGNRFATRGVIEDFLDERLAGRTAQAQFQMGQQMARQIAAVPGGVIPDIRGNGNRRN